jgi:hypothetical protein
MGCEGGEGSEIGSFGWSGAWSGFREFGGSERGRDDVRTVTVGVASCFVKGRGEYRDASIRRAPVGRTAQAQAGRVRARDARLKTARERRLRLDPDQLAREQRIDEAAVDVEVAWEARSVAEHAVTHAEVAAASAINRLLSERLAIKEVVHLTGVDPATVRRLRQLVTRADEG